jgi:hypothetical protein
MTRYTQQAAIDRRFKLQSLKPTQTLARWADASHY